nr:HU family DNA-binding protein [Prevotella sp.]
MNNKEYITQLANNTGFTQEDTQKLVRNIIDAMTEKFSDGDIVSVSNFGVFEVKKRLERVMINPSTKQKMLVPPKLVLNFRPVASIKEKLKNGGEDNE